MATDVDTIAGWEELNDALTSALQEVIEFLAVEPPSDDPASAFQQAQDQMVQLNQLAQELAAIGLEQIDDEIAASGLVEEINDLAREANDEAKALKEAADKLEAIADIIGKIAGIVTKLAGLF